MLVVGPHGRLSTMAGAHTRVAEGKSINVIRMLIDGGADLTTQRRDGQNPRCKWDKWTSVSVHFNRTSTVYYLLSL